MMDFVLNNIEPIGMLLAGWIGAYASFRVRISVLEREVNDLRLMVTELRQDIKMLLSKSK